MQLVRRTKIVATLGPASSDPKVIKRLIEAGVNVFRLNFSHGSREMHQKNVEFIRAEAERLGNPVGILQDLQGPKIRTATFVEGKVMLTEGQSFLLTCGDNSPGDATRVGVTYTNLYTDVKVGDALLLDDGRLALRVTGLRGETIETEVTLGGVLSNNKGINIPDADLSIPAITDKDMEDLLFGAELEVDWVAISFVRSRDDLLLARHYLARAGSRAKLMAKIEKPSAVARFDEILEEVDGIMVARGDLGVELPPEQVPLIQKRLIRACTQAGKPVVTATQMLESMISSPTPTRAEASDVANAIYDGTDAIMLSAETAVGSYPIEAVKMMVRIARSVESDPNYQADMRERYPEPDSTTADAVSLAACQMAHFVSAKMIVTFTSTGTTAQRVAHNRPASPIFALTPSERAYRQLSIVWGVIPALSQEVYSTDEMVEVANAKLVEVMRQITDISVGDRYVITAGVPFGMRGTTNLIRIETVRSETKSS